MLFRAWTAQVYCCPSGGISMDFGLQMLSQLTESGDIIKLLGALCRQMEDFLDHWKRVVTQKRSEHFYLNFYTAEQLVYLSKELRKVSPSDAALMMLSFVKGKCTVDDLFQARRSSESKAPKYCLREVMKELTQQLLSESSLMGKLRVIMEQSVVCMSAFLPHCLDLDALGRCLAKLATLGGSPVERPLPRGLQVGQPNLVLCGHSEVLLAALAIYMQAPRQPLPTYDEVLLCTPGTTAEEVELLLRRCLTPGSQGRKVYSLLFADQLSYEASCKAEELFQSLRTQCHREDYQLVIICDAAREHCYLPSTFSQHKVPLVPQAPLPDIQAYLESHYQVPQQILSAASVFRDRMCVGIVTSERAGVGNDRGPLFRHLPVTLPSPSGVWLFLRCKPVTFWDSVPCLVWNLGNSWEPHSLPSADFCSLCPLRAAGLLCQCLLCLRRNPDHPLVAICFLPLCPLFPEPQSLFSLFPETLAFALSDAPSVARKRRSCPVGDRQGPQRVKGNEASKRSDGALHLV